ncbi:MAG TPA: T9SS type A sorting domain-containing protein [Ignavibacteria bacterium]|nr:T9SS type A sorting domain-containing protein [Ignavibacteria bacterium]HRJ99726.1 T9SS type A sorting domain-containing protein [Ignavibacteria bacterium]
MKKKLFFFLFFALAFSYSSVSAQWSSNPSQNSTICDIKQKQSFAKIAATSDGGCFISWLDQRGNGSYKVYLQRLNALGEKQFAQDGLLVSDKPQNTWVGDYDLKADTSDNAILVFSDIRNSLQDTIANPFIYKISSTGQFLWGADGVTLTSLTSDYQIWPKAAPLSDGSVAVVWWFINSAQNNTWITMQRLNSNGVPQFANPIDIKDPGNKRYQYPDVCAADNGNFILSWVYGPKDTVGSFVPDNISIFSMKYNPSGTPLWNSLGVVYDNTGNHVPIYSVPKIYSDGNGGALYSYFTLELNVLFSSANRILSNGTSPFPPNGAVTSVNNLFFHVDPYLAFNQSTNETYVFWTMADASSQSFFTVGGQKFSGTGQRLWTDSGITYTPLDTLEVFGVNCLLHNNNPVVIYQRAFLNSTIYAFRTDQNGSYVWSGNIINVSNAQSPKSGTSSAINQNGMVMSAWTDGRNSVTFGDGGIYAQNINFNGTIGPVGINVISSEIPESFTLGQNYPNPFNNMTSVEFSINVSGIYKMEIYDITGKLADEVFKEFKSPGTYKLNYDAVKLTTGAYFYKLSSDKINQTKKFLLIK